MSQPFLLGRGACCACATARRVPRTRHPRAPQNGIADVDEISPGELLKRKASVALVTISEPQRLQAAVGALWAAYLAAMATLKMQCAALGRG